MRIMGIDYGDARTGVAISDLLCSIVGSTAVVPSRNTQKALADIVRMAKENEVGEIVVGLPRNMDGTEGVRAELCRAFADMLKEAPDCLWLCGTSGVLRWRLTISCPSTIITSRS